LKRRGGIVLPVISRLRAAQPRIRPRISWQDRWERLDWCVAQSLLASLNEHAQMKRPARLSSRRACR